jgi:hypothetical protein
MAIAELQGPYLLTAEKLRVMALTTKALPGIYALGHTDDEGDFVIETVGRSDENVREKLESLAGRHKNFAFELCHTAKEAFEKECDLFHHFPIHSEILHPGRLLGSYWKCPFCGIFT